MLKYIEKLRAKPTDRMIRIVRMVFALVLFMIITLGITRTYWNYDFFPSWSIYILYIFPLVGFIRGIFDPGIFRRKVWKWVIFSLGIAMMILSIFFIETETVKVNEPVMVESASGEISLGQFTDTSTAIVDPSFAIDTDFWIGFFGFWVAIIGFALTSKNITKKNERFGEKVTKIRV